MTCSNRRRASLLLALPLLTAGCALGPDYERPQLDLPPHYRNAPDAQKTASLADASWREVFLDPLLQDLIERALQQNRDLHSAAQRVIAARANAGAATLARLPQLDASASGDHRRLSREGVSSALAAQQPTLNVYQGGIDARFELDLWGRLQRQSEAARARWRGSEFDLRTVRITLIADIAANYFALQNLDRQLAITHETIATREHSAALIRKRHQAGAVSGLDVSQADAELAAALAAVPDLERQIAATESGLRLLLGDSNAALPRSPRRETFALTIPAGLPSALLERRPDIQFAEQNLIAANADVGAAKAALFPSISLTGALGSESLQLSELFSGPARTWSYGAALGIPLLDASRSGYQLQAAKAQREIAVLQYRQSVQQAFEDVDTALNAYDRFNEQHLSLQGQVEAYARYARLARLRYQSGYSAYNNVLDAERQLFAAELSLASARLNTQTAVVRLYKALGGGWQDEMEATRQP
jgi:multidrug efflux system outer membrane protein